jgi:hypothetical protein
LGEEGTLSAHELSKLARDVGVNRKRRRYVGGGRMRRRSSGGERFGAGGSG